MRGRGRGRGERGRGGRGRGRGAAGARDGDDAGHHQKPAEESKEGHEQKAAPVAPPKEKKAAPVEKKAAPAAPQKAAASGNIFAQMLAGPENAAKQAVEIKAGVKKGKRGPQNMKDPKELK